MARWSKARMPKHWLTALEKRVRTASDMMEAFSDEAKCRRILEAMVWARGHFCPFCGSLSSAPIAGRDVGKKARPGLCQCAEPEYRGQFEYVRGDVHVNAPRASTTGFAGRSQACSIISASSTRSAICTRSRSAGISGSAPAWRPTRAAAAR